MQTSQSEILNTIDKALSILGLRGRTVANFSIISAEMRKVLGKTISATTIYRISSPRTQRYKPFQYSVSLLEEFVESCEPKDQSHRIYSNHLSYNSNPRDSMLYSLMYRLLLEKKWQFINSYISDINLHKRNLGQDRFSVAFALADYIKKISTFKVTDQFVQYIVSSWWFSLIYLETCVDFNNPKKYLQLLQFWLQFNEPESHSEPRMTAYSLQIKNSRLFCYAILPYFRFVSRNPTDLKRAYYILLLETKASAIYSFAKTNPILMTRILASRMLLAHIKNQKKLYTELCLNLEEIELELISQYSNSFEKAFSTCILLDTLLLTDDKKRFLSLLNRSNLSVYQNTGDAALYRLRAYIMWSKKLNSTKASKSTSFILSEGEQKLHELLLKKSKQWLLNKVVTQ